jgi:ABC-type branched-subunit amino acid transport system substrate-binding protein
VPQVAPAGGTLVAILLPLSGPSANLGTALLNAAEMALFELAGPDLTLLPFDSAGTAEGAANAARQAIGQRADIIVGPLFAAEVRAVGPLAEAAHIPVLSLSADVSVAGHGVYVMGFLPGPQAVRVAQYAASQGKTRQAILAPANEYGRRVANAVQNGLDGSGVALGPVEYYDPAALDLTPVLKRLLANRKDDDAGFDARRRARGGARHSGRPRHPARHHAVGRFPSRRAAGPVRRLVCRRRLGRFRRFRQSLRQGLSRGPAAPELAGL